MLAFALTAGCPDYHLVLRRGNRRENNHYGQSLPPPLPRPPQFLIEIPSVVEDRKITAAARAESDALALTAALF